MNILTTRIIFIAYIQSKFIYHLAILDRFTENQQKLLEGIYSNQIKKAFKIPKFVDPTIIKKFFGFITLKEWHNRITFRINTKTVSMLEE